MSEQELNDSIESQHDGELANSTEAEYEEISSDEVDRTIQALEELMQTIESDNIRAYLEEAADHIYALVYDDATDFVEIEEGPQNAAA